MGRSLGKSQGKILYCEPRRNKVSIMLSDRELSVIDEYCRTFGKSSRSAVIREGAIRFVMGHLIDHNTSLFCEEPQAPYGNAAQCQAGQTAAATANRKYRELTPSLFAHLDDWDLDENIIENIDNLNNVDGEDDGQRIEDQNDCPNEDPNEGRE